MHDFPVHGVADGGKGDGGPDADREARYEKEGPPLFPADVVYCNVDQIHRSSLVDRGNRVAVILDRGNRVPVRYVDAVDLVQTVLLHNQKYFAPASRSFAFSTTTCPAIFRESGMGLHPPVTMPMVSHLNDMPQLLQMTVLASCR